MNWNYWIWESSWRVLSSYPTQKEARAAAKHAADPPDTYCVCKAGSERDTYLRQHCTERMAHTGVSSLVEHTRPLYSRDPSGPSRRDEVGYD